MSAIRILKQGALTMSLTDHGKQIRARRPSTGEWAGLALGRLLTWKPWNTPAAANRNPRHLKTMPSIPRCQPHPRFSKKTTLFLAGALLVTSMRPAIGAAPDFPPSNPFYAPSPLSFQAPPFDKIRDADFQPAIEAGIAQQDEEIRAIAGQTDPPTFENTLIPLEKSGQLLDRVMAAFNGLTGANTNPSLQKVKTLEAPKLAAHQDSIYLNGKLFARVAAIYNQRAALKLDGEALRLVEYQYDRFVHSGANLSAADKAELQKLNQEISTLSTTFSNKLLAASKEAAM